jgi:hypothetical protein
MTRYHVIHSTYGNTLFQTNDLEDAKYMCDRWKTMEQYQKLGDIWTVDMTTGEIVYGV